jgi:hypothetical protein
LRINKERFRDVLVAKEPAPKIWTSVSEIAPEIGILRPSSGKADFKIEIWRNLKRCFGADCGLSGSA